jgi:hypothetical protein
MKALGCREAKWNDAVSGHGQVEAGDGGSQQGSGLAGTLPGQQKIGWGMFDGHFGIH